MSNEKALVTVAIGEKYQNVWRKYCKDNWEQYAEKYDYDIIVIDEYIDGSFKSEKSPHWQKCLIFQHSEVQEYEHVVWLDTDIVINYENAPCVVEQTESDKVGVVLRSESLSRQEEIEYGFKRVINNNANPKIRDRGYLTPAEMFDRQGYDQKIDDTFNGGLMVLKPQHQKLLEDVFLNYEENRFSSKENVPLAYHLLKNEAVTGLDPRFNKVFDTEISHHYPFIIQSGMSFSLKTIALITNTLYCNSYFLHFIDSYTRQFIELIIPDGNYPDTLHKAHQKFDDREFVIGEHELKTEF